MCQPNSLWCQLRRVVVENDVASAAFGRLYKFQPRVVQFEA